MNGNGFEEAMGGDAIPVAGVEAIEHTADLGLEIRAPSFRDLLRRAAEGMSWLILEAPQDDATEERRLTLREEGGPALLRAWLRELLYWHEAEGFSAAEFEFSSLVVPRSGGGDREGSLRAVVRGGPDRSPPVRELKGVTLHGLTAEPRGEGWFARVIFDV